MRIKSSKGIIIRNPIVKKLNKDGYVPYINFNKIKSNIIILSYQPGYGKTYTALKFMRQPHNINTFYFTNRHDTIDERLKDWNPKDKPCPTHWMGFNKICQDRSNKSLYKNYKVSPGKLCENCPHKYTCDYILQFNTSERVFSPTEYLSKKQFIDKIKDIKTIFVDERVSKVDTRTFNKTELVTVFKTIKIHSSYITAVNKRNLSFFTLRRQKNILNKYWTAIDTALQNNDKKTLEKLREFNPSSFFEYLKWGNIYNFNKNKYGIPFYYYVFDALNINPDLKVVIMDASFNNRLFQYFLYSYNGEIGFNNPISIQEYTTNEQNKKTIVFKMRPKAWHPKASFTSRYDDKYAEYWVPKHLKKIREIFGNENVGIVTFKDLGEKSKFLGFNVEYYGNLRSKNTFENTPVLVVLGHFFPPMIQSKTDINGIKKNGLQDTINEWFLRNKTTYSIVELKSYIIKKYGTKTKKSKEWRDKYFGDVWPRRYADEWGKTQFQPKDKLKLYPAKTIQDYFDDEVYQAVHRSRGLQKNRIIFLYCWIPPYKKYLTYGGARLYKIVEEFDFRKIQLDDEDEFFDCLKDQIGNRNLINDVIDDLTYTDKSNRNIADDREIYRKNLYKKPDAKGGPATPYIKIVKDGIYRRKSKKKKVIKPHYKINFPP